MFVRLEQRRHSRFPWITLLLVAMCVGGFILVNIHPAGMRPQLIREWGLVPMQLLGGHRPVQQMLRLLSALFVHVNWLHLVGNMLFLLIFGIPTERVLGRGLYLLVFVIGGAAANLAGALSVPMAATAIVGCSGAVSAIMGAYLALFPRAELGVVLPLGFYFEFVRVPALLLIGLWVLVQLVFTWVGPSFGAVVWWTHIAGFVFGLLAAIFMRPALARRQRRGR